MSWACLSVGVKSFVPSCSSLCLFIVVSSWRFVFVCSVIEAAFVFMVSETKGINELISWLVFQPAELCAVIKAIFFSTSRSTTMLLHLYTNGHIKGFLAWLRFRCSVTYCYSYLKCAKKIIWELFWQKFVLRVFHINIFRSFLYLHVHISEFFDLH